MAKPIRIAARKFSPFESAISKPFADFPQNLPTKS